jgi:hypothetical protein
MEWLTSAPCACASKGENSDVIIATIAQIDASLRIRNPSIYLTFCRLSRICPEKRINSFNLTSHASRYIDIE